MEGGLEDESRLRRVFDRFDRDRSGAVDLSELANVMHSMGVRVSDAQLRDLVQQGSSNGTELDCDEFVQLMKIWREAAKLKLFDDVVSTTDNRDKMHDALSTTLLRSDSWGRCAFDALVVVAAFVLYVVVLLDDASRTQSTASLVAQSLSCAVFVVDIAVSALTFRGNDNITISLSSYARSWLVPDVVCAVPWGLVLPASWAVVLKHLPLAKLFKIPSLWTASGRMPMSTRYITFHFKILPIMLLALLFALMVHGFAVGFILVKQESGSDPNLSEGGEYPYTLAVYFVIYTLGTVGFGNVDILTQTEKVYACCVLCGSILVNGFIVGKLVAIMQAADLQKDRTGKLRQTLAVLEHFDLPHALQDEVLQFQDHLLGHALGAHHSATLNGLPPEMHENIGVVVKVKLLSCAPMFTACHAVVKVAVAKSLKNDVRVPEQFVLSIGEPLSTMFFIAHGFVDVFKERGKRVKTLSANRHFGDGMLCDGVVSTVAVKSLGYCNLWCLARSDVVELSGKFRALRDLLANPPAGDGLFRQAPQPVKAPSRASSRPIVSLSEAAEVTDGEAHGGEMEDASQAQVLSRRSERLKALSNRVQSAHQRLAEICENGL